MRSGGAFFWMGRKELLTTVVHLFIHLAGCCHLTPSARNSFAWIASGFPFSQNWSRSFMWLTSADLCSQNWS